MLTISMRSQYEQLMDKFKEAHTEREKLKKSSRSVMEIQSDITTMETEKEQVAQKLSNVKRKVNQTMRTCTNFHANCSGHISIFCLLECMQRLATTRESFNSFDPVQQFFFLAVFLLKPAYSSEILHTKFCRLLRSF